MWRLDEGLILGMLALAISGALWLFFGDWAIDRLSRRRRRRHAH